LLRKGWVNLSWPLILKLLIQRKGSGRNSDLLAIIKHPSPEFSVAYIPYGPEFEPEEERQGPFLEELSECLRPYLPGNCTMIRYELCWNHIGQRRVIILMMKGIGKENLKFRRRR
jgi:hypothetical protein